MTIGMGGVRLGRGVAWIPREWRRVVFPLAVGLVLIAGCSQSHPPPADITALHFSSFTSLPANPPPPVDITLTDRMPVQSIYSLTLALPDFPAGVFSCPSDAGIRYQIAFTSTEGASVNATLNPGGCQEVKLSGSSARRASSAYWASLAQFLAIPEATIYPYPRP